MAETTLLRSNAIVRNASVGTTKPPQVNSGGLPLVQVKMTPGGPQVQEGQQKPVMILPSKNPNGAVATGGLPMVQVKMTQNGPQLDDGQDRPVVIKDRRQPMTAGGLPMVQVRMDGGRPQVQSMPTAQVGPPQIPAAAPALSHQRAPVLPQTTPQGLARAPHVQAAAPQMQSTSVSLGQPRIARVPAPSRAASPAIVLPDVPELTTDQLMLCRFLADKHLAELHRGADAAAAESPDGTADSAAADNIKFVEDMIATFDQAMVSIAVRAEAAANAAAAAAAAPAAPVANAYVAPRPVTGGHPTPAAIAPQSPRNTGYVAQRPGQRFFAAGRLPGGGGQSHAPRRVPRDPNAAPLPPVIVTMDGRQPIVQQTAEVVATAEVVPTEAVPTEAPLPTPSEPVSTPSNGVGDAQG